MLYSVPLADGNDYTDSLLMAARKAYHRMMRLKGIDWMKPIIAASSRESLGHGPQSFSRRVKSTFGGSIWRATEGRYYNSESLRPKEQSESYFYY